MPSAIHGERIHHYQAVEQAAQRRVDAEAGQLRVVRQVGAQQHRGVAEQRAGMEPVPSSATSLAPLAKKAGQGQTIERAVRMIGYHQQRTAGGNTGPVGGVT